MIAREQLLEMFENIRQKTPWPIDDEMLWGYFFTGESEAQLAAAAKVLEADGYRLVELFQPDATEYFVLHVEREERHSPETLHRRNQWFEGFAKRLGLLSYDGMDVGPVRKP